MGLPLYKSINMVKNSLFIVLLLLLVGQLAAEDLVLSDAELANPALLTQLNNYFGCKVWSQDSCLQCSERYFFNKNGICCEVQETCQQFNAKEGVCEKCYEGYVVVNGKCAQLDKSQAAHVGCAIWNNGNCVQCSKRWFFNADKVCVPVSDLCATWKETGECDTCYYGSLVVKGACVVDTDVSIVPNSNLLCKVWASKKCVECSDRTFFNADGVCTAVSAQCGSFDKASGKCLTCFKGYDVVDGNCVYSPSNTAAPADLGCGTWDWNAQKCLKCSNRWAFNQNNVCVPVADLCATSDAAGACLTCYKGYDLKDGQCLYSISNNAKPADSGCATWDWDNQVCLKCSNGWAFNDKKVCVAISDLCKTHDDAGKCLTCFKGYDLKDGQCVFSDSNNAKPADLGCGTWDWDNQVCLKCSNGWFFNAKKVCVPVADQCKTHEDSGNCLTCYLGYDLKDGQCLFSAFNNAKPADSGCGTWDWFNQVCLKCSNGWTFNDKKVCVPVSDQCKTHDDAGKCLTCFKGYDLKDGQCLFSDFNNAKPADAGCGVWDWDNQVCLKCSSRWAFNDKKVCVPVADLCATNDAAGACLTCYKGYDLKDGQCVFSSFNNAKPADSGCGVWDWDNQVCLKCSAHWTFNDKKACVPVSDQCKTHDDAGKCLTCFKGYDLKDGQCLFSSFNNAKPADAGCATWDWDNQVCLKCSSRWAFNDKKVCVPVADLCATNNEAGACLTCFKGYDLKDGQCIFSAFNNAKPADSGCGTWDWDNQVCLKCSNGWTFNDKKVCVPVSDQCKTHNDAGACLTCFKGYDLKDGQCLFSSFNNAKPADSGCGVWDWDNQVCLKCSNGWTFNDKKACVPVSDQCKTHDDTGKCLTCYKGYDLKDGQCLFSDFNNAKPADAGCATWDWDNQVCLKCSSRWAFNDKKVCVPVSDLCATSNEAGACLTCFKGYDLKDGQCIFSAFNNAKPADSGCGTWDWDNQVCLKCSNGWTFNDKKVCVPVSDQCKTHNDAGACLTCYKGYDLKDGQCLFSSFNNAKPADSGCATWDWDNQVCLKCSSRWTFNDKKVCVPVADLCATNNEAGACLTCYKGYDLKDGQCIFSDFNNAKPADAGCGVWDWNNQVCLKCSARWTFNDKKVCVPVSDQCATHNDAGACLTCFKGYDLKDGQCLFSDFNNAKPADSGCGLWDWNNQVCLKCSSRWTFNDKKVCVPVSDLCATHNDAGACLTCFKGYDLKDGQCIFSAFNNAKPADSGCATWDWDNQVCLKCSAHWTFNDKKVCVPVSDQCKTHNDAGACLTCYKGYDLKDGQCLFSSFNNAKPADAGCATWDWDNQVCLKCSSRWTFNDKKVCVPVSDLCATSNESGACLTCFKGYDLKDGQCIFSAFNNAKPADSGCGTWDWDNQVCLKCSNGWTFNDKKVCVPVSDQCKTHNDAGACLTCYKGYDLKDGQCLFSSFNNAKPADSGCATWDWDNQICLKCSARWTFNDKKVCVPVSDQCKTHDDAGKCLTCFKGYDLKDGQCLFSDFNNAKPADAGCATWDWDNQVCLKCSSRWAFNDKKVCVPVSDLCATSNESGACLTCFKGYDLKDGQCIFSAFNNAKPADSGCGTWDWNNQVCLKCSNGWTFNDKKVCVAVSDQCKTHNDAGACLTCYKGYDLKDGQCLFSSFNNAHPADIGCGTWDWDNQKCLKCSNRWFFNANGRCVPVDDNCNTYDAAGACTTCYQGYGLSSGLCVSVNPLCKTLNADGTCASCYPQNVRHNGSCVPISKLANILLYYAECCPEKLAALKAAQKNN